MSRGRREDRWSYWRKLVAEQRNSGLSVAKFCRERHLAAGSFYAWRRKLGAEANMAPDPSDTQFVAVALPGPQCDFELRFPNGIVVTVPGEFEETALTRLLHTMGQLEWGDA